MVYQPATRQSTASRAADRTYTARDRTGPHGTATSWSSRHILKMNTLTHITALLVVVALSSSSVVQSPASGKNFELLILHNNDMHARFEQTSQLSGTCTPADRDAGKCYGGFPRVAYVVKEARKAAASGEGPPVLYLNAGDTYTGTAWFTIYKWRIAAEFVNALQPDAVSLGNSDLTRGSNELSPLLNNVNAPILATNVILKSENGQSNLQKSMILNVEGTKVGLVGYLTPGNDLLDNSDNMEYIDEVIALQEEVAKLQAQNINIIIALGHSDVDKYMEIAKQVDGIDVIIGGHKNVYYWNGQTTNDDLPKTAEPYFVSQQSGRKVLVLETYSYDKYLGSLNVKFDDLGEIINFNADPILLDETVPQDSESVRILTNSYGEVTMTSDEVVGSTVVLLDGETCSTAECNLGNLITDAIVYYHAVRFEGTTWTDVSIAFIHSGAIASSIARGSPSAPVTQGDLLRVLPLESSLVRMSLSGTQLNQLLEQAVANYSISNPTGQLLQFSGIRAVYNVSNDPGSRLVSAVARCWSCVVPEFYEIEANRPYNIAVPAALADGEYGFSVLTDIAREPLGYDEVTCLAEFIRQRSPVYPEVAERLVLTGEVDEPEPDPGSATAITSTMTVVVCALLPLFY